MNLFFVLGLEKVLQRFCLSKVNITIRINFFQKLRIESGRNWNKKIFVFGHKNLYRIQLTPICGKINLINKTMLMLLYQEIHPNHNLLICYTKSNAKNAILKFEDCVEPAILFIYLHSTRNLHAHHYMQIFTNTLIHSKLRNTLLYVENTR